MRVLVVGAGGREHALAWRLSREPGVTALFCAPGNPGIAPVAALVPLDAGDPDALLAFAERASIDLTVIGPELPLDRGVVVASDRAAADAAIRAAMDEQRFGAAGARLVIEACLVGPEVSFFALCDG